jgi:hypothetical protein
MKKTILAKGENWEIYREEGYEVFLEVTGRNIGVEAEAIKGIVKRFKVTLPADFVGNLEGAVLTRDQHWLCYNTLYSTTPYVLRAMQRKPAKVFTVNDFVPLRLRENEAQRILYDLANVGVIDQVEAGWKWKWKVRDES